MSKIALPFAEQEQQFWESVAYRWVESPGILTVIAPDALNNYYTGRWVREFACSPVVGSPIYEEELVPDQRDTYYYHLPNSERLVQVSGQQFLPELLAAIDKNDIAEQAARGEAEFFLLTTGAMMPPHANTGHWIRDVVETWPGVRPGSALNKFHFCCIITAPLPEGLPPLPENCELITVGCELAHENLSIIREAVANYWNSEPPHFQEYLSLTIADMSGGSRSHAALAIEFLLDEWMSDEFQYENWRPSWMSTFVPIKQAQKLLDKEGITLSRLKKRLNGKESDDTFDEIDVIGRLWAYGLWCSGGDSQKSLWHGLTPLAKAALQLSSDEPASLQLPYYPRTSLNLLHKCLEIEQQVKQLLSYMVEPGGRQLLQKALDTPLGQNGYSLRQTIVEQLQERNSQCASQIHDDQFIIKNCSFGQLKNICFLLSDSNKFFPVTLSKTIDRLVPIRNGTAHGEWFTISQYVEACKQLDLATQSITQLTKFPS